MHSILEIKNLTTKFGSQVVHNHLDLKVFDGEVLGIVGGSGSGKSVLLSYMIGLNKPQSGKIIYHGFEAKPVRQMGVLFQHGALISSLTVAENVMIPLREIAKLSPQLSYEIARLKIAMVGLPPVASEKYPSELSGGMIKRAALARALAMDPRILFLDEPTSGLDPISSASFDQLVRRLQKELGMTVVMITHDLDSLVQICDRIAVLIDQQVITGTVKEVASNPHPWIQEYFHGTRGERYFK
jgi:phospholipid/cholesterol/gamma-HCH transport system ATP-binding protein